jgi:EAL domain-containing protein (putative c-di-GMP-specific phosphodiesterase class I)
MAFQPIVDTSTGRPFAYEALVRGVDGAGAASILSQITDENRYSFDQAYRVKAIETALAAGLLESDARLSINFLPNAVYSPMACIQLALETAHAAGLPINRLIFEFTENEEISSPDMSRRSSIPTGALVSRWRSTISARDIPDSTCSRVSCRTRSSSTWAW